MSDWAARLRERLSGPVAFVLDGETYTLPELDAREWLLALLDPDPAAIVPGLLEPADAEALYEAVFDPYDELDFTVLGAIATQVLEDASGRPWYEARRLAVLAAQQWDNGFDGWCASRGVDPLVLPLDRFCNLVWRWAFSSVEHDKADELERQLTATPPGAPAELERRPEWQEDAMASAFETVLATQGRS